MFYVYKSYNVLQTLFVENFLKKSNLDYEIKSFKNISIEDIKYLIKISKSLEAILTSTAIKNLNWDIKFNDLLLEIKAKPHMLRTPLIFNKKNNLIITGSHEDNLDILLRLKE